MGIEVASTECFRLLALCTLDQSCAGIHTPYHHTYRAIELNVCSEQACSLLRLYDSSGRSFFAFSKASAIAASYAASSALLISANTLTGSFGTRISDVVMFPSGTGITVSPLAIELNLG